MPKKTNRLIVILLASLYLPTVVAEESSTTGITPEPIPARFNIPGDQAYLQKIADANDVIKIREHAWQIWAGLTADSQAKYAGKTLPIWETWFATNQAFIANPPKNCPACELVPSKKPSREYRHPHQFSHGASAIVKRENTNPAGLIGFNKFDPSVVKFLWTPQQQNGATFIYTRYNDQMNLNASWLDNTSIANAKINGTPRSALELKPVLMYVSAKGLTALPLWQGPKASNAPACADVNIAELKNPTGKLNPTNCHPDPSTWTHCVLTDPNKPDASLRKATKKEFASALLTQAPACQEKNAQYIGINHLYNFVMDAEEAAAFNQAQGGSAAAGDSMVLMAMHVNTKEIVTWTWQTFWWQAGKKTPDNFPGGDEQRPKDVKAPWNNYNMCAAYAQTTKADNTGDMNVCFNPYLETSATGIPDGIRSNCVSCHGTSAINQPPSGGYPLSYGRPVDLNHSMQYFLCSTSADFSYAITSNAVGQPTGTTPPWSCNR